MALILSAGVSAYPEDGCATFLEVIGLVGAEGGPDRLKELESAGWQHEGHFLVRGPNKIVVLRADPAIAKWFRVNLTTENIARETRWVLNLVRMYWLEQRRTGNALPGYTVNYDPNPPSLGDLSNAEIDQIQNIVNKIGEPLFVVGSAARAKRRNRDTLLPIGKDDPDTKSDIDYVRFLPYAVLDRPMARQRRRQQKFIQQLPNLDETTEAWENILDLTEGPAIYFRPGTSPAFMWTVIP